MTARTRPLPPPKTGRGETTRQKILDAAQAEIGGRGFAETSIASITRAAGVSQGTFYIYFRSKEDVLRELVLHMGRSLRRHLTEAIAGAANRIDAERRGLHAFLVFVRRHPDLYRVVGESQSVDRAIHRRYYMDFARSYRIALAGAEKRGDIRAGDADIRGWSLMGLAHLLGQRYCLWDRRTRLDAVVDAAMDMIEHGLRPPAR